MNDRFRAFYEAVGLKYPEDSIVYETLSGHLRKKWITSKLQHFPKGNLLDCGCNVGTLSKNWHKGNVYGVDIAYAVLRKGKNQSPHVNFVQADLRDMKMFRAGSIDNAMACEVVEHLDAVDRFFENLYRVMKNGGLILITSPNFTTSRPVRVPLGILRSFDINQGTLGDRYLHTAYKPAELASLARRIGFAVIEQGSFEIELRGWLKPITMLRQCFGNIIMYFEPASRMLRLIERILNKMEINAFFILETFAFGSLLKRIFKEGRRSYIVAKK